MSHRGRDLVNGYIAENTLVEFQNAPTPIDWRSADHLEGIGLAGAYAQVGGDAYTARYQPHGRAED
eukprot:9140720-Prorocentrum_lima.AAC.1